jgi:hypothetical protein
VGNFPGRNAIDSSLREVERLLRLDDSFDFFKPSPASKTLCSMSKKTTAISTTSLPSSSPPGSS